ncbi:SAM-dependent methyltransferase, partial [Lachnospiraceae bacterium OttesenSCG-928-D06]|nr:SAM-dependent methyltransferase [Lachnospiraceae bacterium OttesenSCG-928-D06]
MKEKITELLKNVLNSELEWIILSNPKSGSRISKIKVRPVVIKEELLFQETAYVGTQVLHKNYRKDQMEELICDYMETLFAQGEIQTLTEIVYIRISKKGQITIKHKKTAKKNVTMEKESRFSELTHNRVKDYILKEGQAVPFLVELGVQTVDGVIIKSKYDKFKQINRYLEFIEDVMKNLPKDRELNIIDFGCGKSYLTFAMYHYLHEMKKRKVRIIGLDLKEEVIKNCQKLAEKFGYEGLHFEMGDISSYKRDEEVDMVVSLHACDKATDYALEKAIRWNAKVIFAVPCCQHEVNEQIKSELLAPILKYGILKERISALVTDGIRANLLEQHGYETQILEFIDMEHTPKNLLIRAIKGKGMQYVGKKSDFQEMLTSL